MQTQRIFSRFGRGGSWFRSSGSAKSNPLGNAQKTSNNGYHQGGQQRRQQHSGWRSNAQSSFNWARRILSSGRMLLPGGATLAFGAFFWSTNSAKTTKSADEPYQDWPVLEQPLVFAPNVPPPILRNTPVKVKVTIPVTVEERTIDGVHNFEFWTFGGHVPGPFIRTRVGDVLDLTLQNQDGSGMLHNIDFHAVTGPGGGALVTTADSMTEKHAIFKMLKPGLFIYHCAVAPVGEHIGKGMYGLILVEPQGGLPRVDKEYYVLQSEFYTDDEPVPSERHPGKMVYQMDEQKAIDEHPSYVVFNGRVGSLVDDGVLTAKTGDRVRLYFGNAGPNLVSSFHVIGTIFDEVYREGDLVSPPAKGLQTTLVPAGGAAVIDIDVPVPGNFTLVDHSIWRIEKGCVGFLRVDGDPRPDIFWGNEPPRTCPDCKHHP